jgi:hypothetical protein
MEATRVRNTVELEMTVPDLDDSGEVLPEVKEAMGRGVILEVGHEVGSFSVEVARRALAVGLTRSSICRRRCPSPCYWASARETSNLKTAPGSGFGAHRSSIRSP